jgi:hypothetical protein
MLIMVNITCYSPMRFGEQMQRARLIIVAEGTTGHRRRTAHMAVTINTRLVVQVKVLLVLSR